MIDSSSSKVSHSIHSITMVRSSRSSEESSSSSSSDGIDESPKSSSSYNLGVGKNKAMAGETGDESETGIWLNTEESSVLLGPKEGPNSITPQSQPTKDDRRLKKKSSYDLGLGKNSPLASNQDSNSFGENDGELHWYAPDPVKKPKSSRGAVITAAAVATAGAKGNARRTRKMVARNQKDSILRGALWHEEHFDNDKDTPNISPQKTTITDGDNGKFGPPKPAVFYPDIDLSIPGSIYNPECSIDTVWDLMRWEAYQEAQREPLLVSFLHSSILNHASLESSLAFLLANKLNSPAMISTQIQSLILEALSAAPSIGRSLRADIMAVRDRDPACTCLPDVFLYFKGFHALQTYRVAHVLWNAGKHVLAHYLQSQMSQIFQIDIHPNSTLGSGIMLDHGTGIVIGETAMVGHNCSILHHVTLGGSGKKGVDRHPKVGEGVLLGAGASILGNIKIGDGCQVGAGTLVITDLPAHSVAVGVPAKIIGSFVDVTEQPSIEMNQLMDAKIVTFQSDGI